MIAYPVSNVRFELKSGCRAFIVTKTEFVSTNGWVDDALNDRRTAHHLNPRKRTSFRHYIYVSEIGCSISFGKETSRGQAAGRFLNGGLMRCVTRRRVLILAVRSSAALFASGRATDWPGGIRTHWRSPTFTVYWIAGAPHGSNEL